MTRRSILLHQFTIHLLKHSQFQTLLQTIRSWPRDIYDIAAVIVAVRAELDRTSATSSTISSTSKAGVDKEDTRILMECLADLYAFHLIFLHVLIRIVIHCPVITRYVANRQPGKALPFYLRLRRPNVFDLIRDNNLFTDVQDQILLLVEFDHELMEKRNKEIESQGTGIGEQPVESEAIKLLVEHIHSIPVSFCGFFVIT